MTKDDARPDEPLEDGSFEKLASAAEPGLLIEFWDFLKYNKKWWLSPIILVLLLVGLLVFLSSSTAAPFIYTLW